MEPITIIVLGDPKGQPRPKAFVRGGHAAVYDPGTAENWKSQIAVAAKQAGIVGGRILEPVKVTMSCHFKRPKSHFRTGKNAGVMRDDSPKWHTSKPDTDNVIKAALDALTHLGVWKDDAQVVQLAVRKLYSNGAARTGITIEDVE